MRLLLFGRGGWGRGRRRTHVGSCYDRLAILESVSYRLLHRIVSRIGGNVAGCGWICLEVPNQIAGPGQLFTCPAHGDRRNARSWRVIRAAVGADVRIDDVGRLVRRETSERDGLRAQPGRRIREKPRPAYGRQHHRGTDDPDDDDCRDPAQGDDQASDAPAPRESRRRLGDAERVTEWGKAVEDGR